MQTEKYIAEMDMHKYYIGLAIELALQSGDDIPVAALTVRDGEIIAMARNQKEATNDPTAHAEMIVLRDTAKFLDKWRLNDITLYSTLEPCPMCASAILLARIPLIVFSAYDSIYGAMG